MAKILLVEDDNNLREIYGERLMAEGYDIVSASDGEEALQTAVTEKPDLIISDVMMPKISGFDMLDILRQTPETKDVKIIMMTALSQAEDKTRADKLGADKYLVKSQVTLEDVARVVHDLLGDEVDAAEEAADAASPQASTEPTTPTVTTTPLAVTAEPAAAVTPPVAVATPPEPVAVTQPEPPMPQAAPVAAPAPVAPPEPMVTPVAPEPVAPTTQTTADPAATAQAASEPAAVVTPPVAVATPPEPVAVTQPEPPMPQAAPVAAPAPVAPPEPMVTPVAPEPAQASAPVANPVNPISGGAIPSPLDASAAQAQTAQAEDSQQELQEVAQQIEQFVASTAPEVQHEEPVHEPTQQDIIHAQNAAEEPEIVSAQPVVANAAPTTAPPIVPINTNNPEPASSRKKVISPINGDGLSTPDIHALYEQELAKEAANSPVTNPGTGQIVSAPPDQSTQDTDGIQNPISSSPEAAQEIVPPPLETVDATQITGVYASEEEAELAAAGDAIPASGPVPPVQAPAAQPAQQQPSTNPNDPNNIAL